MYLNAAVIKLFPENTGYQMEISVPSTSFFPTSNWSERSKGLQNQTGYCHYSWMPTRT